MKQLVFIFSVLIFAGLLNSCSVKPNPSVSSPDDLVLLSFNDEGGTIKYELRWQNELIIDSSALSILPNVPVKIINATASTRDTTWSPVWGQFSQIRDHYNELVLDLEMEGAKGQLIARVYNQGIGLRFRLKEYVEGTEAALYCEYNLPDADEAYCYNNEKEPLGPLGVKQLKDTTQKTPALGIPIVVEKSTNQHLSLLESDLYSAPGFNVMKLYFNQQKGMLVSLNPTKLTGTQMQTPWRVILLGNTAGDLVTSTVPMNLATPCQLENTDWIKNGKTVWDWRVHGYTAPDGFVYGINNESYKRFIDFAADKGIEYFMIDADWFKSVSAGHFEISDKLDLKMLADYASEKGVDLLLYYDRHKGDFGDEELFPYFQSLGMKGIKYGFMGTNVNFTRNAIVKSAQNKLLIDFHDSPVPFTGISRTYPNAITREYCHAQQDSRRAFTPEAFIKMALINAIQGPLDMNNGNFDLTGINSGKRQKGPRELNSYLSTVTAEAARTLIIFSGLVCIPDAPEAYNAKADLFEFIQKQPVGRWDESRILNSKMGEYITTARRQGKEWFIGSVINQKGGTLPIKLDFLEEGQSYEATFYEDTNETHCKTNPEAYQIRQTEVKKDQLLQATLAPGGGHCMWIRPKVD